MPGNASSGAIVRQTDAPHGPTTLMLVDLPPIGEQLATAPVIMAAASGGEGWRGAALFVMSATGEATPVGRTAPRAVMGQVDEVLSGGNPLLIDEANALHVTLLAEDMELGGADEAALAQGRNLCLVGPELIQFARAVQTGPASFRLEGLRRGLGGTEWAMGEHGADESFLLIDAEQLEQIAAGQGGAGEVGSVLTVAAIGVGDAEPAEAALEVTGEAMRPPAPVHLRAEPDGAGGQIISWIRRSRNGWRWVSGADVPLGEESERYELRVFNGETLLRRVETTIAQWTYDSAAMAADGSGERTVEVRQIGSLASSRPARMTVTA
jgi:hypothetical protein